MPQTHSIHNSLCPKVSVFTATLLMPKITPIIHGLSHHAHAIHTFIPLTIVYSCPVLKYIVLITNLLVPKPIPISLKHHLVYITLTSHTTHPCLSPCAHYEGLSPQYSSVLNMNVCEREYVFPDTITQSHHNHATQHTFISLTMCSLGRFPTIPCAHYELYCPFHSFLCHVYGGCFTHLSSWHVRSCLPPSSFFIFMDVKFYELMSLVKKSSFPSSSSSFSPLNTYFIPHIIHSLTPPLPHTHSSYNFVHPPFPYLTYESCSPSHYLH